MTSCVRSFVTEYLRTWSRSVTIETTCSRAVQTISHLVMVRGSTNLDASHESVDPRPVDSWLNRSNSQNDINNFTLLLYLYCCDYLTLRNIVIIYYRLPTDAYKPNLWWLECKSVFYILCWEVTPHGVVGHAGHGSCRSKVTTYDRQATETELPKHTIHKMVTNLSKAKR